MCRECEADNDDNCAGKLAVERVEQDLNGLGRMPDAALYKELRFKAYRIAAQEYLHGNWWRKGIRQPLPTCVEVAVKTRFPAKAYTGYKCKNVLEGTCTMPVGVSRLLATDAWSCRCLHGHLGLR